MAVRSKMSTARSRGRAVVKTTTGEGDLTKEKPKDYSLTHIGGAREDKDFSIADITPDDYKLLRKQLRISDDQDFVIPKADYDVWKSTGKKSPEEYFKDRQQGKPNPFQQNYYGEKSNTPQPGIELYGKGKAPKAKPDPQNIREAAKKVQPLDKFATLKKSTTGANKDIIKEKANKDIMVPEQVEGPKGRTVTRKKLGVGVKRTSGTVTLRSGAKSNQTGKSFSGTKQRTKEAKDTLQIQKVEKSKGPRLSEKMKYKKEEKLAGARERVLGLSGVATEDQKVVYGKGAEKNKSKASGTGFVKKGEKYKGSAQRLKDIKNTFSSETDAMSDMDLTATGRAGMANRKSALKEAKSDIKQISKLGREYKKSTKSSGTKGQAKTNLKSLREEYRAAKKPVKFSKGTSTETLKQDIESMSKKAKTPAELKSMKSNIKTAAKTARISKNTAAEKESMKIKTDASKKLVKEARSYKGDVRKGLRMEKKDALAMKVADKASEFKKARKAEKGKTMRGTSYFSMTELNKKVPLTKKSSSKIQAGTQRFK